MKKLLLMMFSCVMLLGACMGTKTTQAPAGSEVDQPQEAEPTQAPEAGPEEIHAIIDIKDYGTIDLLLHPECAPITVENFVNLAESGFYDGLTFHRIMYGFMMQGGDPEGTGFGGSDTTIKGEFPANGVDNPLLHKRGTISMARANDPDSASSQFFIMHQDYPSLDGYYAAFGEVVSGIEVVDAVCEAAQPIDNNGTIPAEAQPVINSITIKK